MLSCVPILALIITIELKGQSPDFSRSTDLTHNAVFDTVFDRFGKKYPLAEISKSSSKPFGGPAIINTIPSNSCSAGYFNLYYAPNSLFELVPAFNAVLCQVFTDVSSLLPSPLSSLSSTVKINIYCDNETGSTPASASPVYLFPSLPSNPNGGIVNSTIQDAIFSGNDPFHNLPSQVFIGSNNFYYGYIRMSGSFSWHTDMNTNSLLSGDLDLYTVLLHEVGHLLGIASCIGSNGQSIFNAGNNYFGRFDKFLTNSAGVPLLSPPSTLCPISNVSYTLPSLSWLASSNCVNTGPSINITNCPNSVNFAGSTYTIPIYTPVCFENGGSLSHFEDLCPIPSGNTVAAACFTANSNSNNDGYYTMCNIILPGVCSPKRYFREEEHAALCDIGYTTSSVNISPVAGANYTYSGGACTGVGVWGMNDGVTGNIWTFTTVTGQILIPITGSIIANDSPNTVSITCVESVYNNSTVTITSGSLSITSLPGSGLAIIKYLPVSNTGEIGSPTYVFIYFVPGGCNPPNVCNLVQNGGFENAIPGFQPCGHIGYNPQFYSALECWGAYSGTPDLFVRGCLGTNNLGTNTWNSVPPVDSYNGAPNNSVLGLIVADYTSEGIKNNLSSPLIPGTTYEISLWAMNHPTITAIMNDITPAVITVWSAENFIYTPSLTPLADFTVTQSGLWSHFTSTFVFTPTVNNSAIVIAGNVPQTVSLGISPNKNLYVFIDDVVIRPLPAPVFAIPNATTCGNSSVPDLAQYVQPSTPGVFSGLGISLSSGLYNFNPPSSGTYPVSFTYTDVTGCVNTLWQNISVGPTPTLTVSSSNKICANLSNNSSTLSVSCASCDGTSVYYWQPGSLAGNTVVANPTVTTIYTVVPSGNYCHTSQTLQVIAQASCCTQSITAITSSSTTTSASTLLTSAFNWDYTVTANSWLTLQGTEYLFAPHVKLVVEDAAILWIKGAHLYACHGNMWQGIEVKDGGRVIFQQASGLDNLIEDAVTGISHNSPSGYHPLTSLDIKHTIFNKNYIDIDIANYNSSGAAYPFSINNCVFTCRDLPFTSSAWPLVGMNSIVNTTSAELRTAIHPTTGLDAPYLAQSGFTVTPLKQPYSSSNSRIAIQLYNVGLSTATAMPGITIGTASAASDFNLFDAHVGYIYAINSNVTLQNNVFQNTISGFLPSDLIHGGLTKIPGAAVSSYVTGVMNTKLVMSAGSQAVGNRFWDCHRGICGGSPYLFDLQNAIFRSTQSSLNAGILPGHLGIGLSTNRFDYYIANNEFTNLTTAINIPIASGSFTYGSGSASTNGVYANRIRIDHNTFAAGTSANAFMRQAVHLGGTNSTPWFVPSVSVSPFTQGLIVTNNTISDVTNGVSIYNSTGFQVHIDHNNISLKDEGITQHGINLSNCIPSSSTSIGKNLIASNTVSFSTPSGTTNAQSALIFCGNNGYGVASPSVSCNTLKQGFNGFVFENSNAHAVWAANDMQLPMKRGLVLQNSGLIGVQGGSNTAIANQWTGGTWSGTDYNTWTQASTASLSVLWVRNTSTFVPNNSNGIPNPLSYATSGNYTFMSSPTGGDFHCSQFPNHRLIHVPDPEDYPDESQYFMAQNALYRLLHFNDSTLAAANAAMNAFYLAQDDQNTKKLIQVEELLYSGELTLATDLNNEISPGNTVETHYKTYYALYARYARNNFDHITAEDSVALYDLAMLCPGTKGACIYQAIALYNRVYGILLIPDCDTEAARLISDLGTTEKGAGSNPAWEWNVYPNPAGNQLTLSSTRVESEVLAVDIYDISGRKVVETHVKTKDFISNLELNLINGAYFIIITNSKHEKLSKKLLIAK